MARTMLNDKQWQKLSDMLRQINIYNKPYLRLTVEAMLYRIRIGCPWRDLPSALASSLLHIISNAIGVKRVNGSN